MHINVRRVGAIALIAMIVGCGASREGGLAHVSGTVTLDGKPVTEGYVLVSPTKGRMAKGSIQPDGTFVLGTYDESDGAQIGEHAVTVLPPPIDEGSSQPSGPPSIPSRYAQARSSGLVAKVTPNDENFLELKLTTGRD